MTTDEICCDDYSVTRRSLLKTSGLAAAAGIVSTMFGDVLTSTAFGAAGNDGNVLLVLSLRGGADGMSMVVPHSERAYYSARPGIAVAKDRLLHRDSTFGLHPSFAALSPLWREGKMAAVHATGMIVPNRSHFEAMEAVEDADPGSTARVGWINRMISGLAEPSFFGAVQVGEAVLPTSLTGPSKTIATDSWEGLSVPAGNDPLWNDRMSRSLRLQWQNAGKVVGTAGLDALELARQAGRIAKVDPRPGSTAYADNPLANALKSSAALIKSNVGVSAIAVDFGGWDHHVNLPWLMESQVKTMAGALAAFFSDLGPLADRVTVVTVSEFGRRLAQNGASGLDHGYGNCMLVMGGGVRGGYYAKWPTLASNKQVAGDLAVTHDYRNVFTEVLRTRFPAVNTTKVFPGLSYRQLGFMRP